jgi:hypothetical protein
MRNSRDLRKRAPDLYVTRTVVTGHVREPKVTKKYDVPATPQQRAERHPTVSAEDKTIMEDVLAELNPAAIQRQIQALTAELLTLTTSKAAATARPAVPGPAQRASARESPKPATRAS